MEPEDDIPKKGTPGEDGYDPAGEAPFATPQEEAQEQLDVQEGAPEGAADEPDLGDIADLQNTLEEIQETNESPQPVGPEGGDPKPDTATPAAGGSLPMPQFEPPERGQTLLGIGFQADIPEDADLPVEETHLEAPAPDLAELDETAKAMAAFGEKIEDFHAAGAAGGFDGGYGGSQDAPDVGGGEGGLHQFSESVVQNATTQYEFLKDHARALNDLSRRLEIERL